jgi:hypothetical protein
MTEQSPPSGSATDRRATARPGPFFAWSISATMEDGCIQIQQLSPSQNQNDKHCGFDVSKSTEWMEYLETQEQRQDDVGGAGAYDTMRCDLVLTQPEVPRNGVSNNNDKNKRLRIWGKDYHLQRLEKSYRSLLQSTNATIIDKQQLEKAMTTSETMLQRLLSEAETSTALKMASNKTEEKSQDTIIQLLRVTLLWSPPKVENHDTENNTSTTPKETHKDRIVVRGHACSTAKPIKIHGCPEPIVVSVAVHSTERPAHSRHQLHDATVDESLPTRHDNPQSKIASWCRLRKTMEDPNTFKPPGTSEVLMVRRRTDVDGKPRLEVLEGLTSNFFVIDRHGSLRTATQGVLHGFVRHLVMDAANRCGIPFDPRPIFLHQAHEWKEAFITSSSRLIYPISVILLPEDHNHDDVDANATANPSSPAFVKYWNDPYFDGIGRNAENDHDTSATPKWQMLLNEILQVGGYPLRHRQ